MAAAEERIARRRAAVPVVTYPEDLPVSARRDDIAAALRDAQVVVVAGETGSGKTTQLPKIALELGRGVRGRIGHTQPRRIAARSVAERIAEELGSPLGDVVGYKMRFSDHVSDGTLVKLMTDGVLLAEIAHDRMLRQYDTIILDEAHERSLNIDFLLGYLAQLLPRRPDLKLVITSATIDVERVAAHFAGAPIVEVTGRTYPVEVRYRPVVDPDGPRTADPDRDQVTAVLDAVDELVAEGPGDILVFLAGEREIRDTQDALAERELPFTEIVPLYSRLSAADQHKVFAPHSGRRIVLSTNVAETSLTVPGIRYVIDPGTARISRYSHRTKVQRLPIEPVSQASARQRSGRCGRLGPGIAIRLYTEADFDSRPEFTDPEILRTNLASVLLQMAALDLGDVADFPFVDPPDQRAVADGLALLEELHALDEHGKLTETGRALAALPLDPRMARMVVEADRRGVLEEVLVIAAGLTIQDPRERPTEHQQAAEELHARFADENSDFLALLNLWRYLGEQQEALSGNQFRRTVKREFLHYLRIREWQDLHGQLRGTARRLGMTVGDAGRGARREGHPRRAHRRAAVPRRAAGGAGPDPRRQAGAARSRVPRHPQHPVRDRPRHAAGEEAAALGRGRRAGRDQPAVRPHGGAHRPGGGRAAGRAPGQAAVLRAALGRQARLGRGHRAGHAVRAAARRGPPRAVRLDRPGRVPGAVHPACPRHGGVDDAPPLLGRQPASDRAGRRPRGAGPAARHRRRRRDPVRALRRPDPRRRRLHPALRPLVEDRPPRAARPAHPDAGDAHQRGRGRPGARRGLSGRGPPDTGPHPAAVVRVRARRRGGRRHRRRPARRPRRRGGGDVGGVAGLHRARVCARNW